MKSGQFGRFCQILHVVLALADCHSGTGAVLDGVSSNASCESENDGVLLQKVRVKDVKDPIQNVVSEQTADTADTVLVTPQLDQLDQLDQLGNAPSAKSLGPRMGESYRWGSIGTDRSFGSEAEKTEIGSESHKMERLESSSDSKTGDSFLQVSQFHGHGRAGHGGMHHAVHSVHAAHSMKARGMHIAHHDQEPPPTRHDWHDMEHRQHRRGTLGLGGHRSSAAKASSDFTGQSSRSSQSRSDSLEPPLESGSPSLTLQNAGNLPNAFFNDHQHMGLPQWFEKKKATARSLMFEKCPTQRKRPTLSAVAISNTTNGSSIKVSCNSGQLGGYWSGSDFISRCCEEDYCVGCAIWDNVNGTCEQCMAGYLRKEIGNRTECIICDDDRAWQDENGKTCYDFENEGLCKNGIPPGDNTPFQSLRRRRAGNAST
eukprot:s708_g22.t1